MQDDDVEPEVHTPAMHSWIDAVREHTVMHPFATHSTGGNGKKRKAGPEPPAYSGSFNCARPAKG